MDRVEELLFRCDVGIFSCLDSIGDTNLPLEAFRLFMYVIIW